MNKKRAVVKQLSINVPAGVHEKLKEIAKKRNCTVTWLVSRALYSLIKFEMDHE
jgi:predicted transcriptional regulator